ncbi:hypothetical protein BC831DRAFT_547542 [Entophlyctis helioformis]|nr:hypothetical protein BC831DRAFT_547542 [Entophlyctis helioformis]
MSAVGRTFETSEAPEDPFSVGSDGEYSMSSPEHSIPAPLDPANLPDIMLSPPTERRDPQPPTDDPTSGPAPGQEITAADMPFLPGAARREHAASAVETSGPRMAETLGGMRECDSDDDTCTSLRHGSSRCYIDLTDALVRAADDDFEDERHEAGHMATTSTLAFRPDPSLASPFHQTIAHDAADRGPTGPGEPSEMDAIFGCVPALLMRLEASESALIIEQTKTRRLEAMLDAVMADNSTLRSRIGVMRQLMALGPTESARMAAMQGSLGRVRSLVSTARSLGGEGCS